MSAKNSEYSRAQYRMATSQFSAVVSSFTLGLSTQYKALPEVMGKAVKHS
jgi:hypothetical protein